MLAENASIKFKLTQRMKNPIYLLFLLFLNNMQSQSIIVIDSLNHKPIPFVNIQFNKNNGTYTNENGVFEVNRNTKDTLRLSHISYTDYEVKASDVKDTIILSPNAILLTEVKITNGKKTIKYVDFPRKNSSFGSFPVISKSEIITLITPNIENAYSTITKLDFKFEKKKYEENNNNIKTAFRVNIYDSKKEKIKNKIYSSEVFIIDATKKEKIEIDLNNEYIELSNNGLFIGIEVIGDIDQNGNITKEKSSIRPILTDNTINDYSAKTFLKYTFDKKLNLNPINDIFEKNLNSKINRNLSFGMTISKSN